jgi:ornithine carbamoyltransferase
MKNLISIADMSRSEIGSVFRLTDKLRKDPFKPLLKNKVLAMIFAKPSTRTRISFRVAMNHLGGHAIYLSRDDTQLGRAETIGDTARVMSRYCDFILARLFAHKNILEIADKSSVPVINGLTDLLHPCQALTDLYTVKDKLGSLKGVKLAFVGDARNNVTHSLMHCCRKLGVEMRIGCPDKYRPDPGIMRESPALVFRSPKDAVKKADVVYTDTWVSMGQESKALSLTRALRPYQVNKTLLKNAKKEAIVMHCLPAHRGHEITDDVMDGPRSVVFDQAENRLHVQKAILVMLK